MAKSIKEIGKKAESLIEQGKDADKKVQGFQDRVTSASSRVAAARRQLVAASETDDEGNPKGDVDAARVQLSMAQNQLAASQRALASARSDAERIKQQKNTQVREIEKHNQIEKSNLEKLRQLRSSAFGSDSRALTEGMASRLNEAEESRVALLRSMGIDVTPEYVSVGDDGGFTSEWKGGNFSALDTSGSIQHYEGGGSGTSDGAAQGKGIITPLGGGLGNLISNLFGGKTSDRINQIDSNEYVNKQYTDRDELSDEVDFYAEAYQSNGVEWNRTIRAHESSKDIERFRAIINSHRIGEDSIFYRTASLNDLGAQYANLPLEELVGICYQFEGIMSTAKSTKFASDKVVFEIKAPKGTAGLDLTKVLYYQEAMFDSPYCYVESAGIPPGHSTPHVVIRILSEDEFNKMNIVNSNLNSISTQEALKQYMNSKYDIQLDDSISKLNIDTVKGAISGVETVINDYPDVGKFLKSGITSSSGVMSCTGSKVSFNPDYFSDDYKLRETCTNMSKRGFWVKNASPTSIGVHEAAHGVEWALIQANRKYVTDGQRVSAWNNCSEATDIVREACDNLKSTPYGAGKSSTELIRSISTYAMENDSETMAEAFADVYANGENAQPLSKEITRLTKFIMNKYKGGI